MTRFYLLANAALYAIFAVLCTFRARGSAQSLGFGSLAPHGLSEFLTVYGGLQWGMALFFGWTVWAGQERAGLMFALLLYAGIVVYRATSLAIIRPTATLTWSVAALELVLLLGAVALYVAQRR